MAFHGSSLIWRDQPLLSKWEAAPLWWQVQIPPMWPKPEGRPLWDPDLQLTDKCVLHKLEPNRGAKQTAGQTVVLQTVARCTSHGLPLLFYVRKGTSTFDTDSIHGCTWLLIANVMNNLGCYLNSKKFSCSAGCLLLVLKEFWCVSELTIIPPKIAKEKLMRPSPEMSRDQVPWFQPLYPHPSCEFLTWRQKELKKVSFFFFFAVVDFWTQGLHLEPLPFFFL
jgi:hypothetical protein